MPATIENYSTLISAVVDYLDRPELEPDIPGWIDLVEARFNAALRAREMEATAVLAEGALPGDFLEWIAVDWVGSGRNAAPTFAERDSPEIRHRYRPGGDPQYFTVTGETLRVVPAKAGTLTLTYYAKIPDLSLDADTNWLILKSPEAYLYGTLAEAYIHNKAPDQAQASLQLAMSALGSAGIKADSQKLFRRDARNTELNAEASAVARPK